MQINATHSVRTIRRYKNKHGSEWTSAEGDWYSLEYKAPLISAITNFLQHRPIVAIYHIIQL